MVLTVYARIQYSVYTELPCFHICRMFRIHLDNIFNVTMWLVLLSEIPKLLRLLPSTQSRACLLHKGVSVCYITCNDRVCISLEGAQLCVFL